ncbi:MAG: ABC-F family ATP-binding cassette domain-containing protein [Saprospiraceae bacterium]|nr:ABC-F family ATP-binding cassette domain-containing protein [Saprospiraceae bacterium]MBP7699119.1 ABC-F family ATP-binding cassette domain-containing protein [Saprospiraceae bacterium]
MNYLTLENISKVYGEKVLFNNLSLQIAKGQKIALIAKNGSGKTTLLRVLAGEEAPEGEHAKILLRKDIHTRFLPQEPIFFDQHTILEAVLDGDNPMILAVKEYEKIIHSSQPDDASMQRAMTKMDDLKAWDFDARIKEVLSKLKLEDWDKPVGQLSGGQKKRLALAKIIIEEPDFLILDEPTNHLDLDMIEWLETFLQQPNLTLFMVTHDRYFLERVCNHIVELDRGILYSYKGNYADYLDKKTLRIENESANLDKDRKLYKRELEWVRRTPAARTTKAKSRVDGFEDIKERAAKKMDESNVHLDIKASWLGGKIVELHNIGKSFGNQAIIENFSYKFRRMERVGIVGNNGVGKSTFLRMLTKEIVPDTGKVVLGDTIVFGYYTQDGIQLKADKRVIDVVQDIAEYIPLEKGQKLTAAALLERFLFPRPQQQVYVSQLSGGEKRRLYLLTILMKNPNFLILDEPTNDLDILTLQVLEDFLIDFPGCVVVVTHDRYFMDKIVDHLFIFEGNGNIKDYNGSYSEYRATNADKVNTSPQVVELNIDVPESNKVTHALNKEQKNELKKLEREVQELSKQKKALTEKFNDTSLSNELISQYSKELASVSEMLDQKEMRWLTLAEMY